MVWEGFGREILGLDLADFDDRLWFTWYQVSLYDVRFASDSLFERIAKAVQFLVMIGFAVVGPKYNVGGAKEQAEDDAEGTTSEGYFVSAEILLLYCRCSLTWLLEIIVDIPHDQPNDVSVSVHSIHLAQSTE